MPTVGSELQSNTHTHTHTHTQILFYIEHGGGGKIPSKYLLSNTASNSKVTAVRILHFKWNGYVHDTKFISNQRRIRTALVYDANVERTVVLVAAPAQILSSWVKGTTGTLLEEQSTFSAYLGLQWRDFSQDSHLGQHKHSLKIMEASLRSVRN